MPWRELCVVVLDLLAALDELHRRGITHRDVKPDNVFVLRTLGDHVHVTLLDLGFASVPPERRITGAPEPSRKVFGTFGFIAPELLAGALPEPRCDLYSVGALMYKMLTGQPVPDLRAAPALICIPSPRMFVPTLPEAVDALVMRALSDVEARFQSAAEMAAADPRRDRRRGRWGAARGARAGRSDLRSRDPAG
jgi:serine/threonine protein kinase